jgi:small subunit ribosomal protein S18
MQPKTPQRRASLRRNNKPIPKRRLDISIESIDWKNTELLKKFVTESGKILPRRITGVPARFHRKITNSIKRARQVLLMR